MSTSSIPYSINGAPVNGTSEVQILTIGGSPTTGTFKLKFGPYITGAITFSATNSALVANIQAALRALPGISGAHVTVTVGSATNGIGTFLITFGGNLAALNVALITVHTNSLDGSATLGVTVSVAGVTATRRGSLAGTEIKDTSTGLTYYNSGTQYEPIWTRTADSYAFGVKKVAIGSPALGSNTSVHAAITQTASTQNVTTAITNPDVPRNLIVKGNASGNAGNVTVTGTNALDAVITETFALNGTSAVAGLKAFKTVTNIALPAETHAGTDTVSVGTGSLLGIGAKLSYNGVLRALLNGVVEGTAPTVAVSSSAVESNTVALSSALAGTPVIILYVNDVS